MAPLRLPHGYHLDRVTEPHHTIVRDSEGERVAVFYEYASDRAIADTVRTVVAVACEFGEAANVLEDFAARELAEVLAEEEMWIGGSDPGADKMEAGWTR